MQQTHICLISAQPLANLIPLLLEKPQKVIFLVTPEMKIQSRRLCRLLQPRGIKVEEIEIPAYDLEVVSHIVEKLLQDLSATHEITLNVTGGTKIVAMAAFLPFYTDNRRIIYLDTSNERLLQLSPSEKCIPLTNNLVRPKEYLASYGLDMESDGAPPSGYGERQNHLQKLTYFMAENHAHLGAFNCILSKLWNPKANYANIPFNSLGEHAEELGDILQSCEVASVGNGIINIQGEANRFFCQGGWFEEFVFKQIQALGLKGCAPLINVNLKWDEKGTKLTNNELDVVFTYKNRLHIISCKTARQDTDGGAPSKHALYELDSLADKAGGLYGRAMLVSVRNLTEYDKNRAKRMGLQVCDGLDVLQIGKRIQTWIS